MSAQAIQCDLCNAEIATMLVGNLGNGDQLGVGPACVHAWAQALADATKPKATADDPAPPPGEDAATEGGTAAATPRRPRRTPPRLAVVPEGADDQPSQPSPASATAD